jgi:ABC-2 type transport system permease protein
MGPIMMVAMVPWMLAFPILQNPESTLATVLSLIPVFTPITMFMRIIVSEPPMWQVGLSIALSVATIYVFFWMTAKIFRIGILSYGKRPSPAELWRWLKVA